MGVLIHLGIGLTMSIGPFTLVTIVGYIAFLDRPTPLARRLGLTLEPPPAPTVQSSRAPDESVDITPPIRPLENP